MPRIVFPVTGPPESSIGESRTKETSRGKSPRLSAHTTSSTRNSGGCSFLAAARRPDGATCARFVISALAPTTLSPAMKSALSSNRVKPDDSIALVKNGKSDLVVKVVSYCLTSCSHLTIPGDHPTQGARVDLCFRTSRERRTVLTPLP